MARIEISVNLGENDYDPQEFIDAAVYAEDLGFRTVWFGDHIFPWYHSGKRSSFVWSVMPVALEKTSKIKVGPWVTVPTGARYHPAIIAQAAATLDNLYPGRILLGIGSGEGLNETPFWNGRWPKWEERMERLSYSCLESESLLVRIRPVWYWKRYMRKNRYRYSRYLLYLPKSIGDAVDTKMQYVARIFGQAIVLLPRDWRVSFSFSRLEIGSVTSGSTHLDLPRAKIGQIVSTWPLLMP